MRQTFTQRLSAALKAFSMTFGRGSYWWPSYNVSLGRTAINYQRDVGDGRGNAAVMATLLWVARTFPEAPISVRQRADKEPVDAHPMLDLLRTPNPYYSGTLLWQATVVDWMLGNAYWIKVRSGAGRPVQLWWTPSHLMEPKWPEDDPSVFISHYEYRPPGMQPVKVRPEDVVHLRNGLDPHNPRKGLSPLGSLFREVFTDDEAASFTAVLLRNFGFPGLVVSPDVGEDGVLDDQEAANLKAKFEQSFSGDNRGRVMVSGGRLKVDVVSFSPREMQMRDLRRIPEERITAIFGVPAVVVGLGAGLDRSTFANYSEAREAAYESNIIPTQRLLADELDRQLLPDFGDPTRLQTFFDLSEVRILQEDENAKAERVARLLTSGAITLNQALARLGEDQRPKTEDVYYVPTTVTVTPVAELGLPPEPPPQPTTAETITPPLMAEGQPETRGYRPQGRPPG